MRNSVWVAALILAGSWKARAQVEISIWASPRDTTPQYALPPPFRVGVMPVIGQVVSLLAGSRYQDQFPLTGFTGGVAWPVLASRSFCLRPAVLYARKGTEFRTGRGPGTAAAWTKLSMHYLDLAILVQVRGRFFQGGFGPAVGLALGGREQTGREAAGIRFGPGGPYKRWDYGLRFCLAGAVPLPGGMFTVEVQYGLGLRNTGTRRNPTRNHALSAAMGVAFPLRGRGGTGSPATNRRGQNQQLPEQFPISGRKPNPG